MSRGISLHIKFADGDDWSYLVVFRTFCAQFQAYFHKSYLPAILQQLPQLILCLLMFCLNVLLFVLLDSFTTEDIVYDWKREQNVAWSKQQDLEIAQFALSSVTVQRKYKIYSPGMAKLCSKSE